jgi:hypothetical protein
MATTIFDSVTGYLPWNSWGGTEHLEDKRAAANKYAERITGWSDTETWGLWLDSDRLIALDDAQKVYFNASDAADYWRRIASIWEGYADTMVSIHPDQFEKIAAAVGASSVAATGYRDARNWAGYVKDIVKPPKPAEIPWWIYGIGALALWNLTRK